MVPSWLMHVCGYCGAELPERGYARRRVPGKAGVKDVCRTPCAEDIDRQGTLDVQPRRRKRIVL